MLWAGPAGDSEVGGEHSCPPSHRGGGPRAGKVSSALPEGAEKNQPTKGKGLRADGHGHRPSPWSVGCRPWCRARGRGDVAELRWVSSLHVC